MSVARRAHVLEAEIELTRQSDSFRLLVESVKDYAIFMLDHRGVIKTWNAGAERVKGYAAAEIIGQHFSVFYPKQEVLAGKCDRELETAASEGHFEEEGYRVRKDGTLFWANVVITALRDTSGKLVGFAKVTRDLTERRKAEEERLRLAQAQEANRVRDEVLATVSHELRTPLNAILGWATLLEAREKDPYTSKALNTIVRNAEAQARLIEDLLDVSRIITGKLKLALQPTDLVGIAREAMEVVQPSASAKGLTLRLESSSDQVVLIGDPTRLQQILWNLLSNAVKFNTNGGSIVVHLERDEAVVRLSVRDTGRGIEPEFLPYVFDRFRQADSSAARRAGGLGLGLAIVRQLVELHGGKVAVASAGKQQGSTFTITLPERVSEAVSKGKSEPPPFVGGVTRLDGISVMIVDDEPDARELFSEMLESRGARVILAESARQALKQLGSVRPQVIVSDLGMPDEDGYQFARSVRALAREQGSEVPLVALTGYASAHDRRAAFEAGFNNHVPKPVDAEELATVVRTLAQRSSY